MTPASVIVQRLGGNKAVADFLGLERTAVQRWGYDPPNGRGERIPPKYWAPLMQLAARAGQPLGIADFVEDELVNAGSYASPKPKGRAA